MSYSSNTIATCAVTSLVCVLQLVNFGYSCRVMHAYRSNSHQRQQKQVVAASTSSPRSYPFLIRLLFLLSNVCALACVTGAFFPVMMFVNMKEDDESSTSPSASSSSSVIHIDPWRRTSLSEFNLGTRLCAFGMKFGVSMYVWTKLFSYLFFFVKQRTVRPLSAPSKLEKFTLLLTLGVALFAIVILIVTEPEPNALDGTCQFLLPIYTLFIMAVADVTISILYLYLFIQPLRETIAFNRKATGRSGGVSIGTTTETPPRKYSVLQAEVPPPRSNSIPFSSLPSTTTNVSNDPAAIVHPLSPKAASTSIEVVHVTPAAVGAASSSESPQVNTALEAVMRKNTYACIFTIIFSLFTLSFMVWSHIADEPYSRKWLVVGGSTDIFITCAALSHIMHKPASSSTSSVVKKNQVVPMIQQHGERNKSRTSVQMANEKHQQRRPSIQTGVASVLIAPPSLLDAINKSGWTAQLDTIPRAASESPSFKNTSENAGKKDIAAVTNEVATLANAPVNATDENQHMLAIDIDVHRRETDR